MAHKAPGGGVATGGQAGSHHEHHIVPVKKLMVIFAWLIGLTVLTVLTGTADFGALNFIHVPLALLIAGVKVWLVASVFMGLKHDNRVNSLALVLGFMFVLIFMTFTLIDVAFRGDMSNVDPLSMHDYEAYAIEDSIRLEAVRELQVAPGDYATLDVEEPVDEETMDANRAEPPPTDATNPPGAPDDPTAQDETTESVPTMPTRGQDNR
jgi:cytochrome c oxidase subunit 4